MDGGVGTTRLLVWLLFVFYLYAQRAWLGYTVRERALWEAAVQCETMHWKGSVLEVGMFQSLDVRFR